MFKEPLQADESQPVDAKGWCVTCDMYHYNDKCEKCAAIELYEGASERVRDELKELIENGR